MQTREWQLLDKSTWGEGPWQQEPDKKQWTDSETGYACMIFRAPVTGALCGYVGVPISHPAYGLGYDTKLLRELEAHGGLTFANGCRSVTKAQWRRCKARMADWEAEATDYPNGDAARYLKEYAPVIHDYETWKTYELETGICHVPDPGEPKYLWWLGFDCAHACDLSPAMEALSKRLDFPRMPWLEIDPVWRDVYRDQAYVEAEVTTLAKQVKALDSWSNQLARIRNAVESKLIDFRSWRYRRDMRSGKALRDLQAATAKLQAVDPEFKP